jgi:hypothetical protein
MNFAAMDTLMWCRRLQSGHRIERERLETLGDYSGGSEMAHSVLRMVLHPRGTSNSAVGVEVQTQLRAWNSEVSVDG